MKFRRVWVVLWVACVASACSTLQVEPFPEPIRPPKQLAEDETAVTDAQSSQSADASDGLKITRTPGVTIQRTQAEGFADRLGRDLEGAPIAVTFSGVPLVAFINEVFGSQLGMSFVSMASAFVKRSSSPA